MKVHVFRFNQNRGKRAIKKQYLFSKNLFFFYQLLQVFIFYDFCFADDFEEIKQDLSNFRCEVINNLTGHTEALTELREGMEGLVEDTKIISKKLGVTSSISYPFLRGGQVGGGLSKSGLNPSLSSVSEVSRESRSNEKLPLINKASL